MKYVYSEWLVDRLPEELSDIHISCGVDIIDEEGNEIDSIQWDGYFLEEEGANLVINSTKEGYYIRFEAPALNLADEEHYWLSPNCWDEAESSDFGMFEKGVKND
jgi:hypothetical protein